MGKLKLDLIAKMIEEFADTQEIVEFLTGIADRLKKPPDAVEFPAESYDVEILWECSEKAAYLRERIRKEELVLINDETGAGKIVNAAPPEKADVTNEREGWAALNDKGCPFTINLHAHYFRNKKSLCEKYAIVDDANLVEIYYDVNYCPVCDLKVQQRTHVAPEMLAMLEEVFTCMYDAQLSTVELSGKIQKIIKEARGGE